MIHAYVIGTVVTAPQAVMIAKRRVVPSQQNWARSGAAPCTLCEVETEAVWEGVLGSHTPRVTTWKVIAYGDAANTLDTVQVGEVLTLEGAIWDWQLEGEAVVGTEAELTLHVTGVQSAAGQVERVVTRHATGVAPHVEPLAPPPDDYEFFYDNLS